jgi:hypothetical protein
MGIDQRRLQEMLASLAGASKLVEEHLGVYRQAADQLKIQDDVLKSLLGVTENFKVLKLLGIIDHNDAVETLLGVPPRGPLFDVLTGAYDTRFNKLFGALGPLDREITTALGAYKNLNAVLGVPSEALGRFNVLFGGSVADAAVEFERLRPLLERYEQSIAEEEDESTSRSGLAQLILAIVQGGIEGGLGFNFEFRSPRERARVVVALVVILWRVAFWSHSKDEKHQIPLERLVTAQQFGAVTEALRDLETQAAREHERQQMGTGPQLRSIRKGILRDGPSATAARVSILPVGTRLELIVAINRWYYVQVLDHGSRTDTRGWIYRRAVEHISERQRTQTR